VTITIPCRLRSSIAVMVDCATFEVVARAGVRLIRYGADIAKTRLTNKFEEEHRVIEERVFKQFGDQVPDVADT
jgi:hypothetical protein